MTAVLRACAILLSCSIAAGDLFNLPQKQGFDAKTSEILCILSGQTTNCNVPAATLTPVPTSTVSTSPSPGAPQPGPGPIPSSAPALEPNSPLSSQGPAPGSQQEGPSTSPASVLAPAPVSPNVQSSPATAPLQPPSQLAPAPTPLQLAPVPAPQAPDADVPLIIVAGGYQDQTSRSSNLFYTSRVWQTGPLMVSGRFSFPMLQLSPTEVLAIGGDSTSLPTAEIFSTSTQAWQLTSAMQQYRQNNGAVLLADGTAYTAGGTDESGTVLSSSELYSGGSWIVGPPMSSARTSFTMLTYQDSGKNIVLACGGLGTQYQSLANCEAWSQGAAGFGNISPLVTAVSQYAAVLLDGIPFITGGVDGDDNPTASTQLLGTGFGATWSQKASMQTARFNHEMVVLQNGQVLVCGGTTLLNDDLYTVDTCEIFDGTQWNPGPTLLSQQTLFNMVVLSNGDVLYYGSARTAASPSGIWTPGTPIFVPASSDVDLASRSAFGMSFV